MRRPRQPILFCLAGLVVLVVAATPAVAEPEAERAPSQPAPEADPGFDVGALASPARALKASGLLLGRGVGVSGSRAGFLEDYDSLDTGAGVELSASGEADDGRYFDATGSLLGQVANDGIAAGQLRLRAGKRDVLRLEADLQRSPSFYADIVRRPGTGWDPAAGSEDPLELERTDARVSAELFLGSSRLELVYRHHGNDGDESLIKASPVGTLGPYAFRAPAYKDVEAHADAIDAEVTLLASPVQVTLNGGYTNERNRTGVDEVIVSPSGTEGVRRFGDDIRSEVVRAGVGVTTDPNSAVFARAVYQYVHVDADASPSVQNEAGGSQTVGEVSIRQTSHAGLAAVAYSPLPDTMFVATYTILDLSRTGSGLESRGPGLGVRDDVQKTLLRQRPRIELRYSGLPRTLLRARYRYERRERDLSTQMMSAATDPLGGLGVDRVVDDDRDLHTVVFEGRVRATRQLLMRAGYRFRHEAIREDSNQPLDTDLLGDRNRELHGGFLSARTRLNAKVTLEAVGTIESERYERTQASPGSTASLDAGTATVRAVTRFNPKLLATWFLSYAKRTQDVGTPRRDLAFFAPLEFTGESLSTAVAASYALDEQTSVRGHYALVDVGGSLSNLTNRLLIGVTRRLNDKIGFGLGYSFLDFDDDDLAARGYGAHLGWASVNWVF